MLQVAAVTFAVTPEIGSEGLSLSHESVTDVFSPLNNTLLLLDDGKTRCCLLMTQFAICFNRESNLLRREIGDAIGIPMSQVVVFSTHNHCTTSFTREAIPLDTVLVPGCLEEADLSVEGRQFLRDAVRLARLLPAQLQPAQVWWGTGHERRVTYNRKGRRADGSTYLMREPDRLKLGVDFNGDIDDIATVVAFRDLDNRPLAFLTQFNGHPATAYHPEHPVVFGEFPQVADDDLSAAYGGVPVGFLQGCCGDLNSKGLLSGKPVLEGIADATRFGHYLGETFCRIAEDLQPSATTELALVQHPVRMPFRGVPAEKALRAELAEIADFLQRCTADDEVTTRRCAGLNFPETMTPSYRSLLVQPLQRWTEWALRFRTEGRLSEAPTHIDLEVVALRIGDIGIIGLPCEPFQGIGTLIRQHAPLPLVIPCGYCNDSSVAYVPDSANNGDREYQSSYYRYTTSLLPYRQPAGDLLAHAAVRMLRQML